MTDSISQGLLPAIPKLLLEVPLLSLPSTKEVATEVDAKIRELEEDLIAQKKDISNRSLGLTTDSVVAGFSCDRSVVFHEGIDNVGNVQKEEEAIQEQQRLERIAKREGKEAPAAPVNPYRRDDDATMKRKCEELIALRKTRAKLLAEKVFTLDKNEDVVAAYYAAVEQHVAAQKVPLHEAEAAVELAMRLFIAESYTGELSMAEVEHFRPVLARFSYTEPLEERFVCRLLTTDGEMPTPAIVLPAILLLCLALVSVGRRGESTDAPTTNAEGLTVREPKAAAVEGEEEGERAAVPFRFENNNIWRLRVLYRHQLCLLHRSHTLFLKIADCVDALLLTAPHNADPRILVEVGYVQNYYHKIDLAADNFFKAMKITGLEVKEESFMGVRTRWQQQRVAQQVIKASSKTDDGLALTPEQIAREPLPKVIESEKEGHDILDYPRYNADDAELKDANEHALSPLTVTDKAIILALCLNIRNTNPLHGLVNHHVQIYLERLVVDPAPAPFIHRACLLLLRSRAEKERNRVAQRSFLQVQELLDQFTTRRDPLQPTFYRTDPQYFYMVQYPSMWSMRREFAEFCYDDNLFKTALDLYESIHDFDNVIKCCKKLDKRRRAEHLARDLLETDPSNPMLWVALGDATREDKYLWKAWELSNHKMAAPMRSLARMALEREQYEKVVEYFETATKINPIFGGDWFSLGFASMKLKRFDTGAVAFTRVCQIEPNDPYAWNNLGSMLLQQGKTRAAFNALSQGLRSNRRSWRMWQNYFTIAIDLREVTEATHALQIILDIGAREVRLEPKTMAKFTDLAIQYMKGEIGATDNDFDDAKAEADAAARKAERDAAAAEPTTTASGGLREGVENVDSSAIAHVATAAADGGALGAASSSAAAEEEALPADFAPLCGDVEMPTTFFPAKVAKREAEEKELQRAIIKRYAGRVKSTFRSITDLFVNDCDLYGCIAKLYRFTDGPIDGFKYREKEYRVASQKDQVYRDAAKFSRLVAAIQSLADDAVAMLSYAVDTALWEKDDAVVLGIRATADGEAAAAVANGAKAGDAAKQLKEAVDAVKKTIGHVDAATELSAAHLEEHEGNRTLQVVRKKLNAAIKEANSAKK